MRFIRPCLFVFLVTSFVVGNVVTAQAGTDVTKCNSTIGYDGANIYITSQVCLVVESPSTQPLVVTDFFPNFENDSFLNAIYGHIEVWWTWSDGSHRTHILNSPDYRYCDGCHQEYHYSGYHYTFPNLAKVYATMWENDSRTGYKWKVWLTTPAISMHN